MSDPKPFNGMRYAHKGIRAEVEALEKAARELAAASDEQISQFLERVAVIRSFMKGHTEGEETVLWPALEARFPEVTVPYTLDHKAEEGLFDSVEDLGARLRDARSEDRADLARQLSRQATALNVTISHHSRKEDAQIIRLTEEHISLAEQAGFAQAMIAHLPREKMPKLVPLVLGALVVDEREDFLRGMMRTMPPAAFQQGMARWAKASLPAADWAELVSRIPELSSVAD